METKPLLYGLIGFFLGGFIVALTATSLDEPTQNNMSGGHGSSSMSRKMSMDDMAHGLKNKTGDEFDKAFIEGMIVHHEGAVAMAKLSKNQAKHEEIKQLSEAIITAQEKEITQMKQWQRNWGYTGE